MILEMQYMFWCEGWGLKVMRVVPEKHIINFFGQNKNRKKIKKERSKVYTLPCMCLY